MNEVGVRFSGNGAGAIAAAKETSLAIDKVKVSAAGSSVPLRGMEKDLGRVSRGALAGSGAFGHLGRSVAFASGAFLGAAGFVGVLKSSIDVVLKSQTSIVLLNSAIVNAHASVKALTPVLEAHAAAARKLGFDDDQTREAESKLVTAFGATKKSLDELRVAEDLARSTHQDLSTATTQLILLQEGNMRAAKQFGLALPDLTAKQWAQKAAVDGLTLAQEKGKTLYDEMLPRIKATAAAYANSPAGKIAEFHAQIQHLQESIGTGLLPVVDKYLTRVDDWLAKGKNQKKVTDDVRKVVDELAAVLHDAEGATKDFLKVADPVAKALGGWKTVLEDIAALKVASMIAGWAKPILAASGAAGGLLGKLKALSLSPWTIAIALSFVHPTSKGQSALDKAGIGFLGKIPILGPAFQQEAALEARLFGGSWGTGGGAQKPVQVGKAGSKTGTAVASYAKQYGTGSGITYHWGGVSPMTGFDCSGYIYSAYASAGVTIPRDTRGQWNDPNAVQVPPGSERPGDGVYFEGDRTGKNAGPPPGHVGIYLGGGIYIEYFSEGKPAATANLANAAGYMGARRWLKVGASDAGTSSPYGPPQQSGGGGTATTKTKKPKKPTWIGATQATITSAQGGIAATLRGLPDTLDPVEKNAVAHIEAIQDALHIHMPAAELAKDKVALTRWGKVLHDEIGKNAKLAATAAQAAATEAARQWDQGWQNAASKVLRNFDQQVAQPQLDAFDKETSSTLKAMQDSLATQLSAFDKATSTQLAGIAAKYAQQTPEEKAVADFIAKRSADAEAKQKASLDAQIADTQAQLAALGVSVGPSGGVLIDIATGQRTAISAAGTDIVAQQKTLTDQLLSLQDQRNSLTLDDQQTALQAAADASRTAASDQATIAEQAYQDSRDIDRQALAQKEADAEDAYNAIRATAKQTLQNTLDDQRTALSDDLTQWNIWLSTKAKSWAEFLKYLQANPVTKGFDGSSIANPDFAASLKDPAGAVSPNGDPRGSTRLGTAFAFASGGKVPGRYVGVDDTIMARLTPGEVVLPRAIVAALESGGFGGGGGPVVTIVTLNGQEIIRQTAQGMTAEQARQIGYTIQRG